MTLEQAITITGQARGKLDRALRYLEAQMRADECIRPEYPTEYLMDAQIELVSILNYLVALKKGHITQL